MEQIINNLLELFNYPYTGAVMFLTYFILAKVIKNPKGWMKTWMTVIVGLVLGLIWYYIIEDTDLERLIYSFTFACAVYSLIIKRILQKFKQEYNNNKGII